MKLDKPEASAPPRLEPLHIPKSCDVLANHLRQKILDGSFPDGSLLPGERDLVDQTGLSRGSVREALRILEAEGLVSTRPGRYGGSRATRPSGTTVARQIALFARGSHLPLASIIEAREAVEPPIAELAALHRSDADLAELREIDRRLQQAHDNVPAYLEENVKWHCRLAAASRNPLLEAFMHSLANLIHEASTLHNFATDEVRSLVLQAHTRILDAVEKQDAAAARRRMTRHVQAYSAQLRNLIKQQDQGLI
ncbi:FadR/GntR family transcriptional regulator [Bordetella genomosp. 12]|nr:FadR/GntR family transcriptional regulator [Bordetella genomosp. 12]